jgi:N-acetylmuramoyl-L-alanine amidase
MATRSARQLLARGTARRMVALLATGCVAALVVGISVAGAGPARRQQSTVSDLRQRQFAAAATEFGVPADLLLAVSYALTGWSADGAADGIGPMHLTDADAAAWSADLAGRGRSAREPAAPAAVATAPGLHTLPVAAHLIGVPADRLRTDPAQNIRAGAALLASYATESTGGPLPTSVLGWYGAIARYGTGDAMAGRAFADDVLGLLKTGLPTTVVGGQSFRLAGRPGLAVPGGQRIPNGFGAADVADCPSGLDCRFVPAAYAATGRPGAATAAGPAGYGNYDPANRPADGNEIHYLVIGDTGGTYDAAIAAAQQPTSGRSAHYVIRSADGRVSQLVRTQDIAWQAGNWTMNTTSVGVEVESQPGDGARGYSDAAYRSAARLARWLAAQYGIPLDRQHVLGRDEVPGAAPDGQSARLGNLGSRWDWAKFMSLAGAPLQAQAWRADRVVTIARGSAVALRTEPRADAPLVTSAPAATGMVPPAGAKARADDWAGKVAAGQSYAVADRHDDWIAIWYGGRKAWFADPGSRLTMPGDGVLVTPAAAGGSIPVYAEIAPEPAAYPAGVPASQLVPLATRLPVGQAYVATEPVAAQDYFARFDGAAVPANHTVVSGGSRYVMITFDHRQAYVDAADVVLTGLD